MPPPTTITAPIGGWFLDVGNLLLLDIASVLIKPNI
jgi:hypothetical protein